MRFSTTISTLLLGFALEHSWAFTTPAYAFVQPGVGAFGLDNKSPVMSSSFDSDEKTHMNPGFTADSGMTVEQIPSLIEHMTVDNFDETLEMLEPLLVNECRGETCSMFVEDLREKAEKLGKTVPSDYAPLHV